MSSEASAPPGGLMLRSHDGAGLRLEVRGYQFPRLTSPTDDRWDASWLMVAGEATTRSGTSWVFVDPCLTTWEAAELGRWLRAAATGAFPADASPAVDDSSDWYGDFGRRPGFLHFTEPNLAFRLEALSEGAVALTVQFSHEALPVSPSAPEDLGGRFSLPLTVDRDALAAATAEWLASLRSFPTRGLDQ